jgi:GLPGLI family protein
LPGILKTPEAKPLLQPQRHNYLNCTSKKETMKKIIIACILLTGFTAATTAQQQFLTKAEIEFEVKTNIKKTIGNSSWAEQFKDILPQFKTAYWKYSFSNNKSVYRFDRWADGPKVPEWMRRDDEQNIYYFDYALAKMVQQKSIVGSNFMVDDSIPKIKWRITNESREIAGFNCRKAIGVIQDSVYVFAFYSDEIVIPGGPCTITGLPGMILGLTIPRMYMSFIATKVAVNGVKEEEIKPAPSKKYSNRKELKTLVTERAKEWSSDGDEDSKSWANQFIWSALL